MEHLSVELANYEVAHIRGGARCRGSQEQENSWSPVIYRDFVWCHTVPLPIPSTPSPTRAYTVNMILNETTLRTISVFTVEQFCLQYSHI
jgi:hypothetical protein